MRKKEFLSYWAKLEEPKDTIPIKPVPYKHTGSTFDQDGIRLTGSKKFIDAILSRLTDILDNENGQTRLQVSYQQSKYRDTGELTGAYQCYIQVHQRGGQAILANAIMGIE